MILLKKVLKENKFAQKRTQKNKLLKKVLNKVLKKVIFAQKSKKNEILLKKVTQKSYSNQNCSKKDSKKCF